MSGVALPVDVPQLSLNFTAAVLTTSTLDDTTREGVTYPDYLDTTTYAAGERVVQAYYPVYQRKPLSSGVAVPLGNPSYWAILPNTYWDGVSATAVGTSAVRFNPATGYFSGDQVFGAYAADAWRFAVSESLVGANLGTDPSEDGSTSWATVDPVNRWALFDDKTNTKSLGNFTVTLKTGALADTLGMFEVSGTSVSVVQKDGVTTLYSSGTISLADKPSWFTKSLVTGHANATVEVTFVGVSCGRLAFGTYRDIGNIIYGATAGRKTYGRAVFDPIFGTYDRSRQYTVPTLDCSTNVPSTALGRLSILRAEIAGEPAMWLMSTVANFEILNFFGICEDWDFGIEFLETARGRMRLSGLV